MNTLQRAKLVADTAHCGQFRKYSGEPYVMHCLNVYHIVYEYKVSTEQCAAALLHDTVEDTNVTLEFLTRNFGGNVTQLVSELTNYYTKSLFPDYNREKRFLLELERLSGISPEAQTIKYADLIDNTKDIMVNDPEFAQVYLAEKWRVLKALDKGDPKLRLRAIDQVKGFMQ